MSIRIGVVSVRAEDVQAAAHFYRDVVGLPQLSHAGGRPHFDVQGTFLVILQGKPVPPANPQPARFPVLAFAVDDLDAAVQKLRAHSVELPWGIEEDAHSRWVMLHDPAGNLIELAEFSNDPLAG